MEKMARDRRRAPAICASGQALEAGEVLSGRPVPDAFRKTRAGPTFRGHGFIALQSTNAGGIPELNVHGANRHVERNRHVADMKNALMC
jgi:hypothetical protein